MARILILDYYVDEPACFGVPPYISPYIRYLAGALVQSGHSTNKIDYLTVDLLRQNNFEIQEDYAAIFLVAGHTVPGKYLGGKIGSFAEVMKLLNAEKGKKRPIFIGGPIKFAGKELQEELKSAGGLLVKRDLDQFVLADGFRLDSVFGYDESMLAERFKSDYEHTAIVSVKGAFITTKHPNFPYIINELETYRGCTRSSYCSFCTEAFYGRPTFRPLEDILAEVKELALVGNDYFRLGRQADIFTYGADMKDFVETYPRPRPDRLEALYSGIRKVAPRLKMLHLDNVNPGGLINFPDESRIISSIISEYNTPGDTAAMGLESVDPKVIAINNLKVDGPRAMEAIALINEAGARRENGIPKFLPGLNFIGGLPGEDETSFALGYKFLEELLDSGLMVRRINMRHLVKYAKTKAARSGKNKAAGRLRKKFDHYKELVRKNIDVPMVGRVFPVGTLIDEVVMEKERFDYTLGRPLGSYPMTLKVARPNLTGQVLPQAVVTGHSERTLQALPFPIDWQSLDSQALAFLPGISKKSATDITLNKDTPVLQQVEGLAVHNKNLKTLVDLHKKAPKNRE